MRFLRHMVRWGGVVALLGLVPCAPAQPTSPPEGSSRTAPDVRFTRVENASGPSHNTINTITQDRQGFLWIGTLDGLNRYDGYTFTVYRHDPADTTSLVSSNITVVLEDRAGRLWVGTRGGLDRFERARGRFQHYRLGEGTEATALPIVYQLIEDRAGTVWAGTNRGLFRYDVEQDRFVLHGGRKGGVHRLASDLVYGIQDDAAGALWVLTGQTDGTCCVLYRFDEQASWFQPVAGRTDSFLLVDRADNVWVSATRLGHFDPALRRFTTPAEHLPIENAWEVHEDRNGILWMGSVEGVYRFDPATNELTRHLMNPVRAGRLQEQIASLYEDRSGALWVGTYAGLYRYDRQAKPFTRWTHDARDPNSLSSDVVMAVYEDGDGVLWVGTYGGGLNRIDRSQGRVVRYRAQPNRPNSLCDDLVLSIYEDEEGTLWLGGDEGTLCSYDRQTDRFTRHVLAPLDGETITGGLWTITGNGQGTLWLGTNSGAYRYTPDTGIARRYPHLTNPATTRDWRAAALHLEGDSVLWIGAETGILYRLHLESGHATSYPLVTADGRTVQGGEVWTLHQGTGGALWLGTSAGLSSFDPEAATFRHYFERDGLPGSVVYSILEDEGGRLWLGTNQGLVRFTPQAERFRTYDTKEGVGRTEFNRRAAFLSRRGEMFFGSMNGVLAFFPDAIQDNPYVPPVALTRIQAANREGTSTINPFGLDHLVLSHKDYFFSFEFAALSFTNPERNQYAYRLEGFDEDWVAAGTRRFASYTNIPPGDYVFRVKGSNNDGVWNEEGTALHLTITPPFWLTWWFRLLALAALAGLLVAAYRYRVRRLLERERLHHLAEEKRRSEEEAQRLAELDAAKNRFFANVSHEFRTPLTLILGAADQLDDEAPPPALGGIRRNARRLLRLIDQLLALSKLEAGKLELCPQPGDLAALLRGLVRHFAPLAERKQVTLSFHTDLDRLPAAFDAEKVTTIVSNLLSNALKFTPEGGKVMVTLDRRGERDGVVAEIVVKDTGPGIPKEARARIFDRFEQVNEATRSDPPGTGIGLALAKELAELHGGTILVDSEAGLGSVFTVRLRLTTETDPGSHEEPPLEADVGLNEPKPAPRETNHVRRAAGASTLLIVEDNAEVRALLRGYLEPEYQVIEAADGEAGLAAARTHQPDLVLSDVMMPRMDGVALCNALKADAALGTIPVVLLTAKASDEAAVEGLRAGADDYVTKPFHAGVLRAKLASLVAARQQMRTRFSKELVVKPAEVVVPSEEEAFLEQILSIIEDRLGDTAFDVGVLAQHVGLSRRQVERRLKKVTGQTPAELIRQMRLERAAHLLRANYGSVSEIAYAVGYKSASHFSTAFREAFGHSPSEHFDKAS